MTGIGANFVEDYEKVFQSLIENQKNVFEKKSTKQETLNSFNKIRIMKVVRNTSDTIV